MRRTLQSRKITGLAGGVQVAILAKIAGGRLKSGQSGGNTLDRPKMAAIINSVLYYRLGNHRLN